MATFDLSLEGWSDARRIGLDADAWYGRLIFYCATNWIGCRCLVWQIVLLGSYVVFQEEHRFGFLHGDWKRWWTVDEELSSGTWSLHSDLLPADCCSPSLISNLLY